MQDAVRVPSLASCWLLLESSSSMSHDFERMEGLAGDNVGGWSSILRHGGGGGPLEGLAGDNEGGWSSILRHCGGGGRLGGLAAGHAGGYPRSQGSRFSQSLNSPLESSSSSLRHCGGEGRPDSSFCMTYGVSGWRRDCRRLSRGVRAADLTSRIIAAGIFGLRLGCDALLGWSRSDRFLAAAKHLGSYHAELECLD